MSEINLPRKPDTDSASVVKRYFNTYFGKELAFPSNDVDAVIGFLENKGFDKSAAISTCLLYTSPSPRDLSTSRMPSSA